MNRTDRKRYQKPMLFTRVVELGVFGQYGNDERPNVTNVDPIKVVRGGNMRPL
ncbi:MAG: hypothetical protein R6X25_06415 [Candidatus Krumholzibacteriia bacterium]